MAVNLGVNLCARGYWASPQLKHRTERGRVETASTGFDLPEFDAPAALTQMQLTLDPAHDAKALERSTAKLASSLRSAQNCVDAVRTQSRLKAGGWRRYCGVASRTTVCRMTAGRLTEERQIALLVIEYRIRLHYTEDAGFRRKFPSRTESPKGAMFPFCFHFVASSRSSAPSSRRYRLQ